MGLAYQGRGGAYRERDKVSRRISVTVPDELGAIIEKCARFDNRTIGNLLVHAVVQYVRRYHAQKDRLTEDEARCLDEG